MNLTNPIFHDNDAARAHLEAIRWADGGISEVDDGIWLVSFMHYDLGYIDLEQRILQTIDNPFGTRSSPMS